MPTKEQTWGDSIPSSETANPTSSFSKKYPLLPTSTD
jgi:hypothetical protein